jgi:hypothetical protein
MKIPSQYNRLMPYMIIPIAGALSVMEPIQQPYGFPVVLQMNLAMTGGQRNVDSTSVYHTNTSSLSKGYEGISV